MMSATTIMCLSLYQLLQAYVSNDVSHNNHVSLIMSAITIVSLIRSATCVSNDVNYNNHVFLIMSTTTMMCFSLYQLQQANVSNDVSHNNHVSLSLMISATIHSTCPLFMQPILIYYHPYCHY